MARVREPQRAVLGQHYIMGRVEVTPIETRHKSLRGLAARHIVQPAGALGQAALRSEQCPVGVGNASGRHGHGLGWAQLLPLDGDYVILAAGVGGVSPALQFDARDEYDRQRATAGGLQKIGGSIELVILR